jgi:hypothetical protein
MILFIDFKSPIEQTVLALKRSDKLTFKLIIGSLSLIRLALADEKLITFAREHGRWVGALFREHFSLYLRKSLSFVAM